MEGQNNFVQEPKKKSSIGVVILIIILMIGCLVGGYFLNESDILGGDKETTVVNDDDSDENENSVEEEIDLEEADKILAKFGISPNGSFWSNMSNIYRDGYDDDFKLINAIANVSSDKKTKTTEGTTIEYDDVNEVYKAMYGKDAVKKSTEKYICSYLYGGYAYDSESKTYTTVSPNGCGGSTGPTTYAVREAKIDNNILTITVVYDYGEHSKSEYDSIANYKVTFKKDGKNYIFQNVEAK